MEEHFVKLLHRLEKGDGSEKHYKAIQCLVENVYNSGHHLGMEHVTKLLKCASLHVNKKTKDNMYVIKTVRHLLNKYADYCKVGDVSRAFLELSFNLESPNIVHCMAQDCLKTIFFNEIVTVDLEDLLLKVKKKEVQEKLLDTLMDCYKMYIIEKDRGLFDSHLIPLLFNVKENNIRLLLLNLCFDFNKLFPFDYMNTKHLELVKNYIKNIYVPSIKHLQEEQNAIWQKLWIFLVQYLNKLLHNSKIVNPCLQIIESAFRSQDIEENLKAFDCWKELINNYSLDFKYLTSDRQMNLLMIPLKKKHSKHEEIVLKQFEVYVYLMKMSKEKAVVCINKFCQFYFGYEFDVKNDFLLLGKIAPAIWKDGTEVLLEVLGHKKCDCLNVNGKYELSTVVNNENFVTVSDAICYSTIKCCLSLDEWADKNTHEKVVTCLYSRLFSLIDELNRDAKMNSLKKLLSYLTFYIKVLEKPEFVNSFVNIFFTIFINGHKEILNEIFVFPLYGILLKSTISAELDLILKLVAFESDVENNESFLKQSFVFITELQPSNMKIDSLSLLWIEVGKVCLNKSCSADSKNGFGLKQHFINFLLWPLLHFHHINLADQNEVLTVWSKMYEDFSITSEEEKYLLLKEFCSVLTNKPILRSNVIKFLIVMTNNKYDEAEFVIQILTTAGEILSFPNLSKEDLKNMTDLIRAHTEVPLKNYLITQQDKFIHGVCNCVKLLLQRQQLLQGLECLESLVQKLHKSKYKIIEKSLGSNLESLSINDDYKVTKIALKLLSLMDLNTIENVTKESKNELISPRSFKMVNMVELSKAVSDQKSPLRLLGHFSNTSPVSKLKGNELRDSSKTSPKVWKKPSKVTAKKSPITDDSSDLYVLIDSEVKVDKKKMNRHQREMLRRRREDIPALYQDLSQQSQSNSQTIDSQSFQNEKLSEEDGNKKRQSNENKESVSNSVDKDILVKQNTKQCKIDLTKKIHINKVKLNIENDTNFAANTSVKITELKGKIVQNEIIPKNLDKKPTEENCNSKSVLNEEDKQCQIISNDFDKNVAEDDNKTDIKHFEIKLDDNNSHNTNECLPYKESQVIVSDRDRNSEEIGDLNTKEANKLIIQEPVEIIVIDSDINKIITDSRVGELANKCAKNNSDLIKIIDKHNQIFVQDIINNSDVETTSKVNEELSLINVAIVEGNDVGNNSDSMETTDKQNQIPVQNITDTSDVEITSEVSKELSLNNMDIIGSKGTKHNSDSFETTENQISVQDIIDSRDVERKLKISKELSRIKMDIVGGDCFIVNHPRRRRTIFDVKSLKLSPKCLKKDLPTKASTEKVTTTPKSQRKRKIQLFSTLRADSNKEKSANTSSACGKSVDNKQEDKPDNIILNKDKVEQNFSNNETRIPASNIVDNKQEDKPDNIILNEQILLVKSSFVNAPIVKQNLPNDKMLEDGNKDSEDCKEAAVVEKALLKNTPKAKRKRKANQSNSDEKLNYGENLPSNITPIAKRMKSTPKTKPIIKENGISSSPKNINKHSANTTPKIRQRKKKSEVLSLSMKNFKQNEDEQINFTFDGEVSFNENKAVVSNDTAEIEKKPNTKQVKKGKNDLSTSSKTNLQLDDMPKLKHRKRKNALSISTNIQQVENEPLGEDRKVGVNQRNIQDTIYTNVGFSNKNKFVDLIQNTNSCDSKINSTEETICANKLVAPSSKVIVEETTTCLANYCTDSNEEREKKGFDKTDNHSLIEKESETVPLKLVEICNEGNDEMQKLHKKSNSFEIVSVIVTDEQKLDDNPNIKTDPVNSNLDDFSEDIIESSQESYIDLKSLYSPKMSSLDSCRTKLFSDEVEATNDFIVLTQKLKRADDLICTDVEHKEVTIRQVVDKAMNVDEFQENELRPSIVPEKEKDSNKQSLTDSEKADCQKDTETCDPNASVSCDFEVKLNVGNEILNESDKEFCNLDTESLSPSSTVQNSSISSSPVTVSTPGRDSELLNSTINISPIKYDKNSVILLTDQDESDMFKSKPKSDHKSTRIQKIMENDVTLLKLPSPRSVKLFGLASNNSPKKWFHNKVQMESSTKPSSSLSSPKTDRIKKMMSKCEGTKSDTPMDVIDNFQSPSDNYLTFSRDVPSPFAIPKVSILKRKQPDFSDETPSPCPKRKKVNFSDPPTTCERLIDIDPAEHIWNYGTFDAFSEDIVSNCNKKQKNKKVKKNVKVIVTNKESQNLFICTPVMIEDTPQMEINEKPYSETDIENELSKNFVEETQEENAVLITPDVIEEVPQVEIKLDPQTEQNSIEVQESFVNCNSTDIKSELKSCENVFDTRSEETLGFIGLESCPDDVKNQAVYPSLIECKDDISILVKKMTSLMFVQDLLCVLKNSNVNTVGDLAKLDSITINRLPIKSPKVNTVKSILEEYEKEKREVDDFKVEIENNYTYTSQEKCCIMDKLLKNENANNSEKSDEINNQFDKPRHFKNVDEIRKYIEDLPHDQFDDTMKQLCDLLIDKVGKSYILKQCCAHSNNDP